MKSGWCSPFGVVYHLSGDLHCGCIGRRHPIIGSDPWSEIYHDEVARAMEMLVGYSGRRNTMLGRLEDLLCHMGFPWQRSTMGTNKERKVTRPIKSGENPSQISLGYMSNDEWKHRMGQVRTSLCTPNSSSLQTVDLSRPMK